MNSILRVLSIKSPFHFLWRSTCHDNFVIFHLFWSIDQTWESRDSLLTVIEGIAIVVHVTVQLVLFRWVLIVVDIDWLDRSINGIWILTLPNKDSEVIVSANMTIKGV